MCPGEAPASRGGAKTAVLPPRDFQSPAQRPLALSRWMFIICASASLMRSVIVGLGERYGIGELDCTGCGSLRLVSPARGLYLGILPIRWPLKMCAGRPRKRVEAKPPAR